MSRRKKAAEAFKKFHWGDESSGETRVDAPRIDETTVLYELWTLASISYVTEKNGTHAEWSHDFENEEPRLCATPEGQLVIVGGTYTITGRGIVG